jgi:hypothetical protein
VRLPAGLDDRVGSAVDTDQHRPKVAYVRVDHAEIAFVARPAGDHQHMPVAKPRAEHGQVRPFGEELSLLA